MTEVEDLIRAVQTDHAPTVIKAGQKLLEAAARDPQALLLNSHPVGFAHAKLIEQDGVAIRLHIWPIPPIVPQDPPWLVHRHAWPLRSYVLKGSVSNELFEVSKSDRGDRLLYKVGYDEGESVMRATSDRVDCRRSSVDQIEEGSVYDVPRDAFHSTFSADGVPTATVAVTGDETGLPPLVVGTQTSQSEYRFQRQRLSTEHARAVLASVTSRI